MGIKKILILGSLIITTTICRGANPTLDGTNNYTATGQNYYISTNQVFNNGLQILGGFWLNGLYITNITQALTNINVIVTDPVFVSNVVLITFNYNSTNNLSNLEQNSVLNAYLITGTTNFYRLDFGYLYSGPIYGSIIATNLYTCITNQFTNCVAGKMYSLNVIASNTATTLMIPSSWPHFNNTGWTLSGNYYTQILQTNNEFRLSIHTNVTLSTTYQFYGQSTVTTVSGNVVFSGSFLTPTNTFSGTTFHLGSTVYYDLTGSEVDLQSFDGLVPGYENSGRLVIQAVGSTINVTNPGTWHPSDGLYIRGVTNLDLTTLDVDMMPGVYTNLTITPHYHHP